MYRGIATMTLDTGKCPRWLFERMVKLGREMVRVIVREEGPDAFVKRIADPAWFQSLGTVLAFDWNASGLTTILTAALKEAIKEEEEDIGVFICGGKGKTSRRTPDQIYDWSDRLNFAPSEANALVYNSRMAAKVDSALVQDGFQIYHHTFFFSARKNAKGEREIGAWTVVQQGMNTSQATARRYHWHSNKPQMNADSERIHAEGQTRKIADPDAGARGQFDFVDEPHTGIASQRRAKNPLNLTAKESEKTRDLSTEFVHGGYQQLMKDITLLRKYTTDVSQMVELAKGEQKLKLVALHDTEFSWHPVVTEDFSKSKYLEKILWKLADEEPKSYEKLLATDGVGPKTVRALSLVAEVIYGARPSYEDPARYSFAHGGKDATPYPVDRKTYDETIRTMQKYVEKSRVGPLEKNKIHRRLARSGA